MSINQRAEIPAPTSSASVPAPVVSKPLSYYCSTPPLLGVIAVGTWGNSSELLCDDFDFLGTGSLNPHQEAVVLVVVGDDDSAFLLHGQHILHIVLDVGTRLVQCLVDVLGSEVDNVEAVPQLADDAAYFFVGLFLLIDGDELRHAECRDIKFLAVQRVQVMQAGRILLVTRVSAVAADEYVRVNEDVVRVDRLCRFLHRSECQMGELFLFLSGEQVEVACHPHAQLEVYDLLVLQSRLLKEQL